MDYKEYLLTQSAVNLQYIAEKMWPTNANAKSYLSTKLNGTDPKRPWTASDNEKARQAIHELGLKLIEDTPESGQVEVVIKKPVTKPVKKQLFANKAVDTEPTKAELLKQMLKK